MTQPRCRYDGTDEYGDHWREELTPDGKPTEKYSRCEAPTPPTLAECREVLKALLAESLNGGSRNHTAIQRAYRLIVRIDAQPGADDSGIEGYTIIGEMED